ncbi:MAG: YaiO family outer membrane beta-barrel protein [SAR324 cluster bacterium]|nr:YaiO family outer membrane beta-barrel protein [SAR324 cluster bacterium]
MIKPMRRTGLSRLAALAAITCASVVAAAVVEAEPRAEFEAGRGADRLSNDFDPWRNDYVEGEYSWLRFAKVRGRLNRTTRFNKTDTETIFGIAHPLWPDAVGQVQVSSSRPAHFLPERSAELGLTQSVGGGLVIGGLLRRREYANSEVETVKPGGEWYFDVYRIAYAYEFSRLDTGDSGAVHSFSGSKYYGERSSMNLVLAQGRGIEKISETRVEVFDTRGVALWGRHWWGASWGVTYGVRHLVQGDFYELTGAHAGIRYGF